MTAQFPVEASPWVGKLDNWVEPNIIIVNRGGQVLQWSLDGKPLGSGQDGMVAELPPDRWTTQPSTFNSEHDKIVFASVSGKVVCLDESFRLKWEHQLGGETIFGRAVPAAIGNGRNSRLIFSDASGLLTCLKSDGIIAWTNALGTGPCRAPPNAISGKNGEDLIIAASGSNLFGCDFSGKVIWRREFSAEVITRAEGMTASGRTLIVCGLSNGYLVALDFSGTVVWQQDTGDSFGAWLLVVQRTNANPIIVFSGLWGNLHAVDAEGNAMWTHYFRAKTRALPLLLDKDQKIYVPTFNQHVYAFDLGGRLADDIRLSGILPSGLIAIPQNGGDRSDLLITSTTLLAYRLRQGPPRSTYGPTPSPRNIAISIRANHGIDPAIIIDNPAGALITAHAFATDRQHARKIIGVVTARSAFELSLKPIGVSDGEEVLAEVRDINGNLLADRQWTSPIQHTETNHLASEKLIARPAEPYGSFDEELVITEPENEPASAIQIENLYLDEVDEGAMVVSSGLPIRARVSLGSVARADGLTFGGKIVLRQAIPVGTVNGETVADALPALDDAGLISIGPNRAAKIWLSVDAHNAQPGNYTGQVAVASLGSISNITTLRLSIQVVDLRIPKEFPLSLCTWDYVPNRWFSNDAAATLDDMSRHGVNIFPRTTLPPARVDHTKNLVIDWTPLDAELSRLDARGKILFHLGHPPIEFTGQWNDEAKHRAELDYIRSFRDHLKERGRGYENFALYLLDEPGLDYGTNVASLLDVGKLFREADPKLVLYTDPVPGLSWKDFQRIQPFVDVWAPNMRLVSGLLSGDPRIAQIMKAKTVWSYECVAQVKSISPLRYNRANAWRAKYFGLTGIGFWTHSTTEADVWLPGKTDNDEFALVYPGKYPVPSVRWEAVRDGLEDVSAMTLLEAEIQRHRKSQSNSELLLAAENQLSIAKRDVMELSDQAFVESRDFLKKGDRTLPHTLTDIQMYRRHRAEIARLTLALKQETRH